MTDEKGYAIIRTGGKQYRVAAGDVIDVELSNFTHDAPVEFNEVLFMSNGSEGRVGCPIVSGCIVKGELVGEVKGPKVYAFRYKRRKNYHRKVGHRQNYARIKITGIEG